MLAGFKPARVEALIWTLIYGGLFAIVIGLVAAKVDAVAGWWFAAAGMFAVAVGVVLIWVRSRMAEPPIPNAQSANNSRGGT